MTARFQRWALMLAMLSGVAWACMEWNLSERSEQLMKWVEEQINER